MGQGKSLIYTYCITSNPLTGKIEGINKQRVYGISHTHNRLWAVVSRVDQKDFGKKGLVENLKDPSWMEEMVRKHAEVTGMVMEEQALLPLKFGMIFKSEAGIRDMLAANRQKFLNLLSKFNGKNEWGVKVFADLGKLGDFVKGTNTQIKRLKKEMEESLPGRSYLLQKKLEEGLKKKAEQEVTSLAQKIFAVLTKRSQESQLNKLLPSKLTGKRDEMVLNSVHLVERKNFNGFKKSLNQTLKKFKGLGLSAEISGPWPPYSFVS